MSKAITQGNDPIERAVLQIADTIGGLIEFWGFKRPMGRMWTVMYLSPEPLSAADLCQRLSMSTGAVSMTLQELQKWGVVRKTWQPGSRRDYYEPETSIWKMISRVFRERELTQIRQAIDVLSAATRTLAQMARTDPGRKVHSKFVLGRVEGLLGLARLGETVLDGLLSGRRIDASPIKSFVMG